MPPAPQATNSGQALQNLQSFQGQMKSPDQMLSGQEQSLGVPGAQQQVSGLRQAITNTTNLLNNVAPSVEGRTANSLVTSGQQNRMIANEQAPINTQLKQQGQDFSNASSSLDQLLREAGTRASLESAGQTQQLGLLDSVYRDLASREAAQSAAQLEREKLQNALDVANIRARASNSSGAALAALLGGGQSPATPSGGLPQGMGLKNASAGGKAGFNFSFANNPVSAASYAKLNNLNIADVLYTMANSGDSTAASAYRDIVNSGGNINSGLMNKYSSLFWGEIPSGPGAFKSSQKVNVAAPKSLRLGL